MTTSSHTPSQQLDTSGAAKKSTAVLRMSRLLWVLPLAAGLPVFFAVGEMVPNKHLGDASIADGFRRLSVFCTAMFPVTGLCWFVAILLNATIRVPALRSWRAVVFWSCVCAVATLLVVAAVSL